MATLRLLEHDPDLAAGLQGPEAELARNLVTATVLTVDPGPWDPLEIWSHPTSHVATILIVDGLVARDIVVADRPCRQLLGPGDPIPWPQDGALLPTTVSWTILRQATLAVLGPRWMAAVARWPHLSINLQRRLDALARRMATHQAISQLPRVGDRLLALLLHLAEDWGRVTGSGVIVDLPLTHAELGRLAGARRPTVSLALADLEREGSVQRRPDGSWLLEPQAASTWGVPMPAPALGRPARAAAESAEEPLAPAALDAEAAGDGRPPVDAGRLRERLARIGDVMAREAERSPRLVDSARRLQTASRRARGDAQATRERVVSARRRAP